MSRQFPKRMQEPKSDTGLSDSQLISGVNKFDIQVVEPITDDPMKREGGVRFFSARIKSIQPIRGFNQQFTLGLLLPQQDKKLIGSAVPIDDGVHNKEAFAYVNGFLRGMPGYGCNALLVVDNECQRYPKLLEAAREPVRDEKTDDYVARKYRDWARVSLLGGSTSLQDSLKSRTCSISTLEIQRERVKKKRMD